MSAQFLLPARGPKSKTEGLAPFDFSSTVCERDRAVLTVFEIPILLGWLAPLVGVPF